MQFVNTRLLTRFERLTSIRKVVTDNSKGYNELFRVLLVLTKDGIRVQFLRTHAAHINRLNCMRLSAFPASSHRPTEKLDSKEWRVPEFDPALTQCLQVPRSKWPHVSREKWQKQSSYQCESCISLSIMSSLGTTAGKDIGFYVPRRGRWGGRWSVKVETSQRRKGKKA
jgi:hypothetical protein